jgi:hypothetical protein
LVTILSPEESQAFYGSTYNLSVKLQHTPGYDVSLRFEGKSLQVPGMFPADNCKFETVQVLSKYESPPGTTIMNVLIPKSGDWRMRAMEQPKQSPKPGITGPNRQFLVIAPGQKTVYAEISASQSNYAGPCPVSITYKGLIGSAIKGSVQYQFIRSWDSGTTPLQTEKLDAPGTIQVTTNYPFDYKANPSDPTSGWVALRVIGGGKEYISNHANFTISCQIAIDPNLMKYLSVSLGGWKSLEKMSPPPQACQGCVSTYNQIAGIDQKSMPLVQEGEGLLGAGAQDKTKEPRLNQIKTQLDANMVQRKPC